MTRASAPLRIGIVTEFVRVFQTASSAWAPLLARELASRGHTVTVLADGIEHPDCFGSLPVVVHRHGRIHHGCEPMGFRRWCADALAKINADATLSLTDHVAADLWLPLGPGPGAFLRNLRHTTLVGAAMDLAHRPYVLLELLSQHAARRDAQKQSARRVCFAADPASQSLPYGSLVLPTTATLVPPAQNACMKMRTTLRASLGIVPTTPLLLLSVNNHEVEYLSAVFEALAQLRAHSSATPRFLLASRTPTFLRHQASAWGVQDAILPAGSTRQPELLLAACDAVLQPCPARAGESSGRLIADALTMGVPVLADATAPGSSLIANGAGIRLHAPTAASWRDAILHACDPAWRARASSACHGLVPPLSLLVDALEESLATAASRRRPSHTPVTESHDPASATA